MTQTTLYRHFDDAGQLLYVGISISALARQIAHRAEAHWWNDVASMTIGRFPSFADAENVERIAIAMEQPAHNTHRRRHRPEPAFEPEAPTPRIDVREDMTEAEVQEARDRDPWKAMAQNGAAAIRSSRGMNIGTDRLRMPPSRCGADLDFSEVSGQMLGHPASPTVSVAPDPWQSPAMPDAEALHEIVDALRVLADRAQQAGYPGCRALITMTAEGVKQSGAREDERWAAAGRPDDGTRRPRDP